MSTHFMGKLTIVGFFSTKKLFFVNLCGQEGEYEMMVIWNPG